MGCSALLAKAKEGGHPMSQKGRDTRQSWPSQPTLYSLGMTMVSSIVWWLLQSVDFDYQYLHGRRLQASSQDDFTARSS